MNVAQDNVLAADAEMATCKEKLKHGDGNEKNKITERLKKLQTTLHGSYTDLRCAPDALSKAIKLKRHN